MEDSQVESSTREVQFLLRSYQRSEQENQRPFDARDQAKLESSLKVSDPRRAEARRNRIVGQLACLSHAGKGR